MIVLKKQLCKPIWKRCFTFALAAALVMQMIASPSLTAFAAEDTAATVSASDLQAVETVSSEPQTETPAAEDAVEDSAPEADLKAAPTEPEAAEAVTYLDVDGSVQSVTDYNEVTKKSHNLSNSGWYVVKSSCSVSSNIVVGEDVKLILCDGATLTTTGGISVVSGKKLTIYAQSTGSNKGAISAKAKSNYAAIGGYGSKASTRQAGTIIINGGKITASAASSKYVAAIGGAQSGGVDNITINGGEVNVTATSNYLFSAYSALGFGFGGNRKDSNVTINGGQVKVTGPTCNNGYGIGAKTIKLSYTNSTDSIYATSYYKAPTLEKDFIIEGTETDATPTNIAGKTIVPKPAPLTVYSITYDLDDGEVANANPTEYTVETETFTLNNPTREGYTFIGWSGTGIDGTAMVVTVEKGSEGDRAYKANWQINQYTVTIVENEGCDIKVLAVEDGDGENSQGETKLLHNGDAVDYNTDIDVTVTARPGYDLESASAQMGDEEINLLEVTSVTVNNDISISANVKMKHFSLEDIKHDNGAAPAVICGDYALYAIPYGTEVEITAGEPDEGYEFIGFYRSNGVLLEKNTTYTFTVIAVPMIEARYQKISGNVVTFMSNGQVYKSETYETFTADDMPADPSAAYGFEFKGWSMTPEQINEALQNGNVTVEALFEPVKESFVVSIYNGESETPEEVNCTEGKIITRKATAVEGKHFAYWTLDNDIISYNPTVSYFATKGGELRAVYSTDQVEAIATATIKFVKYNVETKKLTVNAYLALPNDQCTIVKAGLVAAAADGSYNPDDELTDENADYAKFLKSAEGKSAPVDYTWNKSNVFPGNEWYVRARLCYKDENGVEHTVYGPRITITAGTDYDSTEKGTAKIKDYKYVPETNRATFIAYLAVPENGVIVKAGLVASSSKEFDFENDVLTASNAKYVKSLAAAVGKSAPVNYTWNKNNIIEGDDWYARAWLVYDLDGVRHTVYSDLVVLKTK